MGDQLVRKVWAYVENNYQRKNDLYGSIVKTIEGSAHFEQSTLKTVIEARANATQVKEDISDPAT